MELITALIALAVITLGGSGIRKELSDSPTFSTIQNMKQKYGFTRIIAGGVMAAILLHYLVT
jgi:hypothetical protein